MFINDTAIDFFTNNMILAKIHAEKDTATSDRYHAKAYPTSILVRKNGEEVDRLVGYAPTQDYIKTFVDFTKGIGTLEDLVARAETASDRGLYLQIADKYKYRGKGPEAQTWYTKVIESGQPLDSLSGEARMAFADFYRRDKDYAKALEEYQKIAAEFTTYHGRDAVLMQAIVYRKMADTAKAIAQFEKYIEQFPQSEDVEYAREEMGKLKNPPDTTAN
ncbi:MAG: tetratricopeptide repeat protein [candidate division Zixibacteria bacterium]|nr:tetratricopeptide repeat protein [candidate division Zixibacteria bacterium]